MELLMVCICLCATLLLILLFSRSLRHEAKRHRLHLPPSPPTIPILGHLHLLQLPLHYSLHKLSQIHGPIFFIWMGSSPALVVSSPSWVKEFMHTHDREFADRPQFEASKRIFYNSRTMVMMEYGPRWRDLRKLYTVHILSSKCMEKFESHRLEEMVLSLKLIESQASGKGAESAVDMRKLVFNTVGNMMTRMLFGKRSFDARESVDAGHRHASTDGGHSGFKEMVEESATLFGTPFLGDLVPWLSWLDVQGLRKRMDKVAQKLDGFFEGVLVERIALRRGANSEAHTESDYLDMLLHIYIDEDGRVDKDSIKCILMDLLTAGAETTTTAIEWTLAELLNNPSHVKKLQKELDTMVADEGVAFGGSGQCIQDSQLAKLSYLKAIVKESLRLHPPFAVNVRQMCKELDKGMQVGGYHLPKKTRVFMNLWAMARDHIIWGPNADMFSPDRFLQGDLPDLHGQHCEFLPFGTGRRGCPGMNMALTVVPFVVANLVLMFDWELPEGVTLDLSEGMSLTAPLAKPLVAVPNLRQRS